MKLCESLAQSPALIATLKIRIDNNDELHDPSSVKVVSDNNGNALYFSRHPVPFVRSEAEKDRWLDSYAYFRHIGIYAFKKEVISDIQKMEVCELEKAESLEQLRWLYNGISIKTVETEWRSLSIDTAEDIAAVENFLKIHKEF
jgi:3-deoxy-manno-octulosonate cytidylyltransferase (CMP-KDO synthetase)